MAQIFVLSGSDIGRSFEVKNGDTLGRSTDCVVTLKDASISRRHAHLERTHNAWFIVDDRSRNGVSIDGVKVPRGELHDMSEFKVGEVLLRFRVTAPSAPAPVIAAKPALPLRTTMSRSKRLTFKPSERLALLNPDVAPSRIGVVPIPNGPGLTTLPGITSASMTNP